jgi:hypothetical protein
MAVDQKNMQATQSGSFNMNQGFPIPNHTYNLMQALVSKCEAIEAYRKYTKDQGGEFFQKMIQQEWNAAQEIAGQLKNSFK